MSSKKANDPIDFILNSSISNVLVSGLAHLYQKKPQFPVEYLAKWLKQYSKGQQRSIALQSTKSQKQQKLNAFQQSINNKIANTLKISSSLDRQKVSSQEQYERKIQETKFLGDLLQDYLPSVIEKNCSLRGIQLTGAYVGLLTYKFKRIQEHNFEPNAEYDLQSPKVIQYVGASLSHKFMIKQILPNQSGRSYEVLKEEEEAPAQEQQGKPVKQKKKYLYSPFVQKDEKIFYFKFPKLGSFACFPLKIKSCLFSQAFDKGIGDYKAFVKAKEQIEKQYSQRYNEIKHAYDQAKRKYQQHQGPQDDPAFQADHANLLQQFKKHKVSLQQIEANRPVIQPFKYEIRLLDHVFSVDNLGKDTQIPQQILNYIQNKINNFKLKWQQKQFKMLQEDILLYLQEESTLQTLDNYFKDQERIVINNNESQIKEQYPNKQKQAQFELSLIKIAKTIKILQEPSFLSSMNTYLSYNLPKYKEIIQIILMILHYPKEQINLPRTNLLNYRKFITKTCIEEMLIQLEKYQLRRQSSPSVQPQYKINKILQRLEKIDAEGVAKYNTWLSALLSIAKNICWARIQCKNAKIQIHEAKMKAKNDREAQITKYQEQMNKALEVVKAQLNEETLPNFDEQDWIKNYLNQNVKPQVIHVQELALFLDIE